MERKFSQHLRSFQELLLREAKVDEDINLLSALKIFVMLRKPVLLSLFLFMFLELYLTILFNKHTIHNFLKLLLLMTASVEKKTVSTTFLDNFRSSYPELFPIYLRKL